MSTVRRTEKSIVPSFILKILFVFLIAIALGTSAQARCTSFIFGKDATVDGSVVVGHTDCGGNSRIHVVPGETFEPGTMAPVHWGIGSVPRGSTYEYRGQVIGYIPEVEQTYSYFHTAYSMVNEKQVAIAETTTSQLDELRAYYGMCKQIMTVQQVTVFALQRSKTAREALAVITSLMEEYGFLPHCCGAFPDGETLLIGDPNEGWILHLFSVGNDWDPESGEPGVLWAAQRVPDDHITVVPNHAIIRELDPANNPDQLASSNIFSFAIDRGWYDPDSGKPFILNEVYSPPPTEGNMNRFYIFYSTFCPSLMKHRVWNPITYYPFSAKPDLKVSVQDGLWLSRHVLEDTIWDMSADEYWVVPDHRGGFTQSPLKTPVPTMEMRDLLGIRWSRPIASGNYTIVAQLRSWLPDAIGGVYWLTIGRRPTGVYVPIYAGVTDINPLYKVWDPSAFQHDSARWAVEYVDALINLRYQSAWPILLSVRDPLEAGFFAEQSKIDRIALALYEQDPALAKEYLTQYTWKTMDMAMEAYTKLRYDLITAVMPNHGSPRTEGGSYRGDDFVPAWPR